MEQFILPLLVTFKVQVNPKYLPSRLISHDSIMLKHFPLLCQIRKSKIEFNIIRCVYFFLPATGYFQQHCCRGFRFMIAIIDTDIWQKNADTHIHTLRFVFVLESFLGCFFLLFERYHFSAWVLCMISFLWNFIELLFSVSFWRQTEKAGCHNSGVKTSKTTRNPWQWREWRTKSNVLFYRQQNSVQTWIWWLQNYKKKLFNRYFKSYQCQYTGTLELDNQYSFACVYHCHMLK